MRSHKTYRDEERRALLFAALLRGSQSLHRFGSDTAIRVVVVFDIRGLEGSSAR